MAMLFLSFGIMVGFVFSSHLDYYLNPCIIIIFPIVYLIAATQFPETPQYLLKKQQIDKARDAFKFYKNLPKQPEHIEATSAKQQEVEENAEFRELKESILSSNGQTEKLKLADFGNAYTVNVFSPLDFIEFCFFYFSEWRFIESILYGLHANGLESVFGKFCFFQLYVGYICSNWH